MSKLVFPDYSHCLLNITSSILKNYNVNLGYKSLDSLDFVLQKKYKNIIFYLVDAMGTEIIKKHNDKTSFLLSKLEDSLTTVFPSTTVAATTTAITGLPPVATAWIGWQQYVAEENKNVVFFLNQDYYDETFKFTYNVSEKYLPVKKIYELINERNKNVVTHEIFPEFRVPKHKKIKDQVDTVLETIKNNENNFIYAYWDKLDTYLHEYGTTSKIVNDHISEINNAMKYLFDNIDEETLVVITADHGQVDVEGINLYEYLDIVGMLEHKPAVEGRATAFYLKSGMNEEFEECFNKCFKDKFLLYKSEDVLRMNLFGEGNINSKIKDFIGDYFAIAIDKYHFVFQDLGHKHKATHAGLLKDEMMIPLILLKKSSL
ncbi:MAG: alkaline phosphatase family protein [Candidatus Izemoplasmatales bacterium]|nr:alkaline phosphatase family protein [Candidatus Izemoplasmatales bacterium]